MQKLGSDQRYHTSPVCGSQTATSRTAVPNTYTVLDEHCLTHALQSVQCILYSKQPLLCKVGQHLINLTDFCIISFHGVFQPKRVGLRARIMRNLKLRSGKPRSQRAIKPQQPRVRWRPRPMPLEPSANSTFPFANPRPLLPLPQRRVPSVPRRRRGAVLLLILSCR